MSRIAKLALEDGSVWTGAAFGADGEVAGNLCFHTGMIGYQEVLTDPSSKGQIALLTYPEIGNYGVNSEDVQSGTVQTEGLVIHALSSRVSNFRSECDLDTYLKRFDKPGISGLDTRAIVRRLRKSGSQRAVLSTTDLDDTSLIAKARNFQSVTPLTETVEADSSYDWDQPLPEWYTFSSKPDRREVPSPNGCTCHNPDAKKSPLVIVLDFGVRWGLANQLFDMGCRVKVIPGSKANVDSLKMYQPSAVVLSSGPGNPATQPERVVPFVETVRGLLGLPLPIFAVGFGTLLLGMACGAKVVKLPCGHHGSNLAVRDNGTGTALSTAQNHDFTLDKDSLPPCLEVTYTNIHDGSIEGIRHKDTGAFGTMFYPDPCALPDGCKSLLEVFRDRFVLNRTVPTRTEL